MYEIGKRIRGKKIICEISKAISTFISDNQIGWFRCIFDWTMQCTTANIWMERLKTLSYRVRNRCNTLTKERRWEYILLEIDGNFKIKVLIDFNDPLTLTQSYRTHLD